MNLFNAESPPATSLLPESVPKWIAISYSSACNCKESTKNGEKGDKNRSKIHD